MYKLISSAMETCDSCAQAGQNSGVQPVDKSTTATNPGPKADDTGVNRNKQDGFTYDEGKGVKDTVLLTGPLSEVYTQALNVYFAKKPLDTSGVDEETIKETQPAVETLAMDEYLMQKALKDQAQSDVGEAEFSGDTDYAAANDDPSTVSNTGFIVSDSDVFVPEIIEHVNKLAQASPKPVYVVVVASSHGETKGVRLGKQLIEIDPHDSTFILFTDREEKLAFEELFEPSVKFCNGFSAFVKQVEAK